MKYNFRFLCVLNNKRNFDILLINLYSFSNHAFHNESNIDVNV